MEIIWNFVPTLQGSTSFHIFQETVLAWDTLNEGFIIHSKSDDASPTVHRTFNWLISSFLDENVSEEYSNFSLQ